jgi:hypothetical protein
MFIQKKIFILFIKLETRTKNEFDFNQKFTKKTGYLSSISERIIQNKFVKY